MKENWSTRDISLASALITLNFNLTNIDYQIEGSKGTPVGYFYFELTDELKNAEKLYWQGKLLIEPKSFVTNWKSLKAQVTNVYKNPNSDFSQK